MRSRKAYVWFGAATLAAAWPNAAEEAGDEADLREVVVAVGTRAEPRAVADAPVPVDVVAAEALTSQGSGDLTNLLRTAIPAYHVNVNPSRDAAALLRPVNLRGLAPDHTLVLVNNKRRHRGAVIQWISNGASDGAQGADISALPVAAIERVEVLRDGASSQYGSDAIAGVVNFVLKDAAEGGTFEIKHGVYTEDARERVTTVSGNVGLPFGDDGFLNLTAEYNIQTATDRSVQHPDAMALDALGVTVADPAKPWGDAAIDGLKTFVNMSHALSETASVYAFGNYSSRDAETAFFYRSPQGRSGVYQNGGRILIGGGAACKAKYDYPATAANVLMVRDLLAADSACFAFAEMLPEGFTPTFGGTMTDHSALAGVRGDLASGLSYDIFASYGRNGVEFHIEDTVNASYGPNTPHAFDLGEYIQTDTSLHADIAYSADVGPASTLDVAAGLEWRREQFEIIAGERTSWDTGPYGADGFSSRSNGFGGFNPASAGEWKRGNLAAYLDLEADFTETLRVGGALRWEDFDTFGQVTTFKVTGRLQVSESMALRASTGSGFRAPTPGQQNANNLSTVVDSATGVFREQGTIASTNPLAMELGGGALDAERSHNWSGGVVFGFDNGMALTVDWFRIDLEDRIAMSDTMDVDADLARRLAAAGVPAAADFQRIRFFTNDYDTRTEGLDARASHQIETPWGELDLSIAYNRTRTEVKRALRASTRTRTPSIERGAPGSRLSLAASHTRGNTTLSARYNYYGSWFDSDDGASHDGYGYLDLGVRYDVDRFSFAVGLDNALDTYPDVANRSPSSGRLYPRYSPAGYNGRMLYARFQHRFGRSSPPAPAVTPPAPVPPAPEPPPPPPPEPPSAPEDLVVLFAFDQTDISPRDGRRLADYARAVDEYDAQVARDVRCAVMVEGHTDDRGADAYNMQLGARRAEAVAAQLMAEGIAAERIETKSYGERRPAMDNATDADRALNRRAVVRCD